MKKKLLSLFLTICLILPCALSLTACDGNTPFNLANSMIKNFANYKSIAAAYVNTNNNGAVGYASTNDEQDEIKLIGIKQNNDLEVVKFNDNGEEKEQTWHLRDMLTLGRFTFVNYTQDKDYIFNSWDNKDNTGSRAYSFTSNPSSISYIIDTKNGKVYPTDDVKEKLSSGIETNPVYGHMGYTENEVFVLNSLVNDIIIYKICIENENLVVKEIINNDHLDFCDRGMLVDKYGNVFLKASQNLSENKYNYIILNSGSIKIIDNLSLQQDITGVVYRGGNKYNADGEEVFRAEEEFFLPNTYKLIYQDQDIKYYLKDGPADLTAGPPELNYSSLAKVTWDSVNNYYTFELTELSNYSSEYACTPTKLYFLKTQSIFYYDLVNKTYNNVISDYIFSSIKLSYNNSVVFTGIDTYLQKVTGIINDDGTLDINITDNGFEVIYVKPIN